MPERNDRNTQACRHSRRRCAVTGQAEATNKIAKPQKEARQDQRARKESLTVLDPTRVAQHPQARIPNRPDSSTEEFGACHADVISTPHDSMRCCDQGPRLGANAFSGRISSCHQNRPRCSRVLDADSRVFLLTLLSNTELVRCRLDLPAAVRLRAAFRGPFPQRFRPRDASLFRVCASLNPQGVRWQFEQLDGL